MTTSSETNPCSTTAEQALALAMGQLIQKRANVDRALGDLYAQAGDKEDSLCELRGQHFGISLALQVLDDMKNRIRRGETLR